MSERPSGDRVERAHPLGDGVAGLTREVDEFVQLEMEIAEVGADDVPVRLLALQMEFHDVDEDPLQIVRSSVEA